MHGNRKLCRIFLGKWIGAPYKILTTKKPPNLSMRGLFVWPIILRLVRLLLLQLEQVALLQFALEPEF